MMIDATLNLSRFRCNAESDAFGAEPYLWTVFFYSDLTTINGSGGAPGLVATHTPHQASTTRGMYPNGIEAGDDVVVPQSMGEFDVTLDSGDVGLSLLGCLFVLIDERNTDADAIKAGHVAFGVSAHEALNALAADKLVADDKTPTSDEVKAMAAYIGSAVTAAIKGQLSWWDYLDQQDRFVGSGFRVYSDAQIGEIAGEDGGVDQFTVNIRSERVVPKLHGFPPQPHHPAETTTLIDDYDVVGTLRVRSSDPMSDTTGPEKDQYNRAVEVLQEVWSRMTVLEREASGAEGDEREELLNRLRRTRKVTLKAALRALGSTRRAHDTKRADASRQDELARHRWCVESDCCTEHAQQAYVRCLADGWGQTYCRELARYRFDLCKNPGALRPPAPPALPASRR